MNKINKKLGLALLASTFMLFNPVASYAADATGNATVDIAAAISVTETTSMDFGIIGADPSGDTVTISTAGSVSASGSSDLSGSPAAGAFSATGTASSSVAVSYSSGDVLTGPGSNMALGSFTDNAGAAFDGSGNLAFNVGASLTVGASQTPGTYTGTYTVTVNYN